MATVTSSETVYREVRGGTTRWRFRYTLDDGTTHERQAWVPNTRGEAEERAARGAALLEELAEEEMRGLLDG